MDTTIDHQLKTVDEILKLQGFTSVEQLNQEIQGMLSPEQKAAYEEQVKHIRNQDSTTDKILEASTAVSFIAGATGLAGSCRHALPCPQPFELPRLTNNCHQQLPPWPES